MGVVFSLALLSVFAYYHTAHYGTRAVRAMVQAEALDGYQDLKSRAPGAVHPRFRGPEFHRCRAILPGLIKCTYDVSLGKKAGGLYESLYFWNGRHCERLSHQMLIVY